MEVKPFGLALTGGLVTLHAMSPEETYQLLRILTSPVVAITTRRGDKLNGMISDGVVRASIVPDIPRIIILVHKVNFSHELIHHSGRFALHVLHEGQLDVVQQLGFASGRERDKLAGVPHHLGDLGLPVLDDHVAAFECDVINAMDTGSSTCFLGEARAVHKGAGTRPMSPFYLREHIPTELQAEYLSNLAAAQDWARAQSYNFTRIPLEPGIK
jgi:flavin reductase (DIM6/NTAB) family NADH-FMN oxidoreductase RutF